MTALATKPTKTGNLSLIPNTLPHQSLTKKTKKTFWAYRHAQKAVQLR